MIVERYEKIFLWLSGAVLVAALVAVGASVFVGDHHVVGPAGRIDPKEVRTTAPFDEPGVREVGPNEYEVVMVAQHPVFTPGEVRVPAGSEVTFVVTSVDVVHGFLLRDTDVNAMIVPGQITQVSTTFDDPGEHVFLCHEYCGLSHHRMAGRVVVE